MHIIQVIIIQYQLNVRRNKGYSDDVMSNIIKECEPFHCLDKIKKQV